MPTTGPNAPARPDAPVVAVPDLTPSYLASLPQAQQTVVLGTKLHALVSATHPSVAGKVTGMLLELGTVEVLRLIGSPAALTDRVREAVEMLRAHNFQRG